MSDESIQVPYLSRKPRSPSRTGACSSRHSLQGLLESPTGRPYHPHHRAVFIERLRWTLVTNDSRRIHGNVVKDYAPPVMFTHQMRDQPSFIPELRSAGIGNPVQG